MYKAMIRLGSIKKWAYDQSCFPVWTLTLPAWYGGPLLCKVTIYTKKKCNALGKGLSASVMSSAFLLKPSLAGYQNFLDGLTKLMSWLMGRGRVRSSI